MQLFFYGLFMDQDLLAKKGVAAFNPRKAYLEDYSLKIGNRASLIPAEEDRAYGMLMSLEEDAVQELYGEAIVADYLPEYVQVKTENKEPIEAICYNLPLEALSGTNVAYAQALYELALKLGFPDAYLLKIKKMGATGI